MRFLEPLLRSGAVSSVYCAAAFFGRKYLPLVKSNPPLIQIILFLAIAVVGQEALFLGLREFDDHQKPECVVRSTFLKRFLSVLAVGVCLLGSVAFRLPKGLWTETAVVLAVMVGWLVAEHHFEQSQNIDEQAPLPSSVKLQIAKVDMPSKDMQKRASLGRFQIRKTSLELAAEFFRGRNSTHSTTAASKSIRSTKKGVRTSSRERRSSTHYEPDIKAEPGKPILHHGTPVVQKIKSFFQRRFKPLQPGPVPDSIDVNQLRLFKKKIESEKSQEALLSSVPAVPSSLASVNSLSAPHRVKFSLPKPSDIHEAVGPVIKRSVSSKRASSPVKPVKKSTASTRKSARISTRHQQKSPLRSRSRSGKRK